VGLVWRNGGERGVLASGTSVQGVEWVRVGVGVTRKTGGTTVATWWIREVTKKGSAVSFGAMRRNVGLW
jgi:hypothetical protein